MINFSDLYGNYRNRTFSDIWEDFESFLEDYRLNGIGQVLQSQQSLQTLYFLLYARYGNSTIASFDENQFKYKVFAIIFMYGPTWEKRVQLQKEIRELKIEDLVKGATAIYNTALNPSTSPSTETLEELPYIDSQNVNKYKKSIGDAYRQLIELLETDVTAYFLDRFKSLFLSFVAPEKPLWYVTDLKEGEKEDE